ncbi:hypothetical protein TWF506_002469 [Arthrobotrys conoides]|uniref:Uncharacterized protein n=1 Tax=Arthrobotrys conoides TaxID=74498 RepID=A0AAN8RUU8_9PEZI
MRFLSFIGAAILLFDLPFAITHPADASVQSLKHDLKKRLWLADLPPIEPENPGGFYLQRDQGKIDHLIKYGDGPNCLLVLLSSSRANIEDEERWIGWPLGNDTYRYKGDNKCQNFKPLNKMLPNRVSSYQVTGYCECEFFDNENCEDGKFSAFNRADDSLKLHGNNDLLESYRCWKEMHLKKGVTCLLFYGPAGLRGRLGEKMGRSTLDGEDISMDDGYVMATIQRDMMFLNGPESELKCYTMRPGVLVESIVVRGCSCVFYLDDNCTMPLSNSLTGKYGIGNAGWDSKAAIGDLDKTSFGSLRSYTCAPPYGISEYARYGNLP